MLLWRIATRIRARSQTGGWTTDGRWRTVGLRSGTVAAVLGWTVARVAHRWRLLLLLRWRWAAAGRTAGGSDRLRWISAAGWAVLVAWWRLLWLTGGRALGVACWRWRLLLLGVLLLVWRWWTAGNVAVRVGWPDGWRLLLVCDRRTGVGWRLRMVALRWWLLRRLLLAGLLLAGRGLLLAGRTGRWGSASVGRIALLGWRLWRAVGA